MTLALKQMLFYASNSEKCALFSVARSCDTRWNLLWNARQGVYLGINDRLFLNKRIKVKILHTYVVLVFDKTSLNLCQFELISWPVGFSRPGIYRCGDLGRYRPNEVGWRGLPGTCSMVFFNINDVMWHLPYGISWCQCKYKVEVMWRFRRVLFGDDVFVDCGLICGRILILIGPLESWENCPSYWQW